MLLAISMMLYGVLMRYIVLPITDWLDSILSTSSGWRKSAKPPLRGSHCSGPPLQWRNEAILPSILFTPHLPTRCAGDLHVVHNL